jgi:hypothetical protein
LQRGYHCLKLDPINVLERSPGIPLSGMVFSYHKTFILSFVSIHEETEGETRMKHNIIQKKIQEDFALIQENLQAAESMHPVIGIKAIEQRSAIEDALYNLLEKYGSFVLSQ